MILPENLLEVKPEKIGDILLLRISGRLDAVGGPQAEKKSAGID